ncbi:MAG: hypothetical protein IPJ65_06240 [Archangiaceae bacterium]|nr:hypothetical protein [Archangiaceae bacterium]
MNNGSSPPLHRTGATHELAPHPPRRTRVVASACNSPGYLKTSYGAPVHIESAVFVPSIDAQGRTYGATVLLADVPDLCRSLRSGRMPRKMSGLQLELVRFGQNGLLAPDVGEYNVIAAQPTRVGSYASGLLLESDANCTNTLSATEAVFRSGIVTVDRFETGHDGFVSGSFEATCGQGDEASGRFSAEYCEITAPQLSCQ